MTKSISWAPQARRDTTELVAFLYERDPDVARRFLDAVDATLTEIANIPGLGTPCPFPAGAALGLLMWRVKGFPNHLIFFREQGESIDVVRVLHASRDLETTFSDA